MSRVLNQPVRLSWPRTSLPRATHRHDIERPATVARMVPPSKQSFRPKVIRSSKCPPKRYG
jgi:hypothetical protein